MTRETDAVFAATEEGGMGLFVGVCGVGVGVEVVDVKGRGSCGWVRLGVG